MKPMSTNGFVTEQTIDSVSSCLLYTATATLHERGTSQIIPLRGKPTARGDILVQGKKGSAPQGGVCVVEQDSTITDSIVLRIKDKIWLRQQCNKSPAQLTTHANDAKHLWETNWDKPTGWAVMMDDTLSMSTGRGLVERWSGGQGVIRLVLSGGNPTGLMPEDKEEARDNPWVCCSDLRACHVMLKFSGKTHLTVMVPKTTTFSTLCDVTDDTSVEFMSSHTVQKYSSCKKHRQSMRNVNTRHIMVERTISSYYVQILTKGVHKIQIRTNNIKYYQFLVRNDFISARVVADRKRVPILHRTYVALWSDSISH